MRLQYFQCISNGLSKFYTVIDINIKCITSRAQHLVSYTYHLDWNNRFFILHRHHIKSELRRCFTQTFVKTHLFKPQCQFVWLMSKVLVSMEQFWRILKQRLCIVSQGINVMMNNTLSIITMDAMWGLCSMHTLPDSVKLRPCQSSYNPVSQVMAMSLNAADIKPDIIPQHSVINNAAAMALACDQWRLGTHCHWASIKET